ncbi:sulfite exporter TauE/SafE family protein [Arhodomonas sp. AD133]|uniref:sulfite exporter TauE/SafE family protein n=1 Tax=Arhodomonas sp. AD133 TaxID=3415009 RepID=UPI003EBA675E
MEVLLIYLAVGIAAGFASGLFGIGGGLIIVPVLLAVFAWQGVDPAVATHLAVGSSLATIIVTSISSLRAHWRLDNILWATWRPLAVGLVLGAIAGAQIAGLMPGDLLRSVFAAFVLIMAVRMALGGQPPAHRQVPGAAGLGATGVGIGAISSIVGIGGGSLTVPFLAWCGVEMRRAVGTSAACGLPIALAGTAGFVIAGGLHARAALPAGSTGFIYWPAVAGIAAASVLLAPVGARLASRLPQRTLKRAFALFLAVVGVRLFLS